jgi:hypothetical protein
VKVERMRRDVLKIILIILMLNLFLASTGFAPPVTVMSADPSVIQDDQIEPGAPTLSIYPTTDDHNATIAGDLNAYDQNNATYATISLPAGTATTWYYFDVKTFDFTLTKEYMTLDLHVNYSVTSWRGQYRFVLIVSGTRALLDVTSNVNVTTPTLRSWTSVTEPNDGLWNQTDIDNLILRVEIRRTTGNTKYWCTFQEYEAWATNPTDSFSVRINISDVTQMVLWQVNMSYNPSVLEVVTVGEGPFLKSVTPPPPYPPPGTNFVISYGENSVQAVCVLKNYNYGGANGSGVLATFHFRAIGQGNSILNISAPATYLMTWDGVTLVDIPCDKSDSFFQYLIGDANNDGAVNVFDILAVKSRWGRTPDSPDWIREYDVNNDGAMNVFDILTVKAHWGESW